MNQLPMPGADVSYLPRAIDITTADRVFLALRSQTTWQQQTIRMFGRTVNVPRLTAWHGDPGATYTYSGIRHEPADWTPALLELRDIAQKACGVVFNSALLNLYRNGRDFVSWHADDEPELGPCIASVSLGGTRVMRFKPRVKGATDQTVLSLQHGSLLIMRGETQANYLHTVPRAVRSVGERINVTFRQITA